MAALVARRELDGVTDLADTYLLHVFPDAVGLPSDARADCLRRNLALGITGADV